MSSQSSDVDLSTPSAEAAPAQESSSEYESESSASDEEKEKKGEEQSLFKQLRNKSLNAEIISFQWMDQYMDSPDAALVKFMQFILEASGSRYHIPKDLKQPFCHNEILTVATREFQSTSPGYPLLLRNHRSLAKDLASFVQKLLSSADEMILNLDILLRHITSFVMACSELDLRAIRHTSTLIGVKMLTTLNDLFAVKRTDLASLWMEMFSCVFVQRCRDVVDDIRLICVAECGIWMRKHPDSFLKNHHIEHIFEALQDSAAKVRESSLETLLALFENPHLRQGCLEFGAKFRQTIFDQIADSDSELGELAVKLLVNLYKMKPASLSDEMCKAIEELLFAAHRGLAQAAAPLFKLRHFSRGAAEDSNEAHIRELLRFFVGFGKHEHAAYLFDALYGSSDIVLDWSCMVQMLLEPPLQQGALRTAELSALIELMCRGVKQAVTGEVPPGRYTKDLERQPDPAAQQLATESFASSLPALIRKHRYSERHEDLMNLIELPQYMDLMGYLGHGPRQQLHDLLDQLFEIAFRQEHVEVLRIAAKTFECIFTAQKTPPGDLRARHDELLNNAVITYKEADNALPNLAPVGIAAKTAATAAQARRLLLALRLIAAIYAHFDLNAWELTASLFSRLQQAARQSSGQSQLQPETLKLYLEVCYSALSWDFKRAKESAEAGSAVEDACALLRENLETFLYVAFNLIQYSQDLDTSRKAFAFACDLFVLFADQLRQNPSAAIRALEYKVSISELELLESFLLRHVFAVAPAELVKEHCAELQDNRRLLASYCKLVAYNVLPIMRGCVIFQHYDKYYAAYGDILRATLERGLRINPIHYGMTLMHTCMLPYKRICAVNESVAAAAKTPEFAELLGLARRLAATFNPHRLAGRTGVVTLHRAGIMYAAEMEPEDATGAPEHLHFLTVIQQFTPQLLVQDKIDMLEFLNRFVQPALPSCRAEEWQPMGAYHVSLKSHSRRQSLQDRSARDGSPIDSRLVSMPSLVPKIYQKREK